MATKSQNSGVVKGEIVVTFKNDIPNESAGQLLRSYGLNYIKTDDVNLGKAFFYENRGKTYLVKVPVGKEKYWIEKLKNEKSVNIADYNPDISQGIVD